MIYSHHLENAHSTASDRAHARSLLESLRDESGTAAMMALFVLSTIFFLIVSGLTLLQLSKSVITEQLIYHGQTVNAAQAGLVDSLSWFRRQTTQPVAQFDPLRDLSQDPPINDSDDATLGIVRDYEISSLGAVWGRYEVLRSAVTDVTEERGKAGTGSVWQVDSTGIVYVRRDPDKAYDEYPNRRLGHVTVRTELQRLSIVLPGNAAICAARGDGVLTESSTRVLGGTGIGILYASSTGSPSIAGDVAGLQSTSTVTPYLDGIAQVFGVTQRELVGMADLVADNVSDLPAVLPSMSLTVARGDLTFTPAHPLVGTGVLVVLGNLTIERDSLSSFNGLIYTAGNFEQNSPSQVSGAVVARGDVNILGSGDFSEVNYDPALLDQIQRQMGQYRFSRSAVILSN